MTDAAPQTIYLADYTPPNYLVDAAELTFDLHPTKTLVTSKIAFRPNPETTDRAFFLHGEDLSLKWARIDGQNCTPDVTAEGLTAEVPDAPFTWECQVEISPSTNTALEGLYMSNGMYCTQCEAQGFRKITYYPDRPDVMSTFTVRIEGDLPVMLSNGNPTGSGDGFAEWHDPWPKPAYLFALVAGDLRNYPGSFTTASGREVELNIWTRPGPDEGKCAFGMEALKASMTWDEQAYGREYDLDLFNIVAVDDFNMGAMENKGLNIFNSSAVLASPETATDANFERIEAIIAHEYFHNWTGNRITCRDWFQLCLKEGLTVFRDQQFTSDLRGEAVKRINDVLALRGRQFREDNGPLAHPVRPESFVEINNFYTATVYEKGAEVIGMLKRLVGDEAYSKALDVYFERHDGDAATIEDWLKVFEDVTGRDLTQFKRWYSQAGTPRVSVTESWEPPSTVEVPDQVRDATAQVASEGTYTLTFSQETPPTPGQPQKDPRVIPIALGLLAPDGREILPTTLIEMSEATHVFTHKAAERPTPSILRGFSAPVILKHDSSAADRALLLAHDTDPFNRWEAGRSLAKETLVDMVLNGAAPDGALLDGLLATLRDETLDPAFRALALAQPGEDDIAQTIADAGAVPDPMAIHRASETLRTATAQHLQDHLASTYAAHQIAGPYTPDAGPAGQRALANTVLRLLTRLDGGSTAQNQFDAADNMTQELAALSALLLIGKADKALTSFEEKWRSDRLVMDKWFSLQTSMAAPESATKTAETLTKRPDFDLKNPNRFRATIGGLTANPAGFHVASGAGYAFVADWLIKLDALNPQTTARMSSCFETWKRYDADRQALITDQLTRILDTPNLSRDTTEMITRIKGA